eukprot:12920223-Prorocentrum_lima.AAC.1
MYWHLGPRHLACTERSLLLNSINPSPVLASVSFKGVVGYQSTCHFPFVTHTQELADPVKNWFT